MTISVIIPAYNSEKTIEACLQSGMEAQPKKKEIMVVDNNSSDRMRDIVKRYKHIRVVVEKKRGPAAARNAGLKKIRNSIVVFVDSDVIVKKNTFSELLQYLSDERVAGVGGIPKSYDRTNIISLSHDIRLFGNTTLDVQLREVNHIPTMIVAYKTKVLRDVGYFNVAFVPSGEDVDLSYRIVDRGYKLLINPRARVLHNHPLSVGSLVKKWFDYGIGWASLAIKYRQHAEAVASIGWICAVVVLLVLTILDVRMSMLFVVVFLAPWLFYYCVPTVRFLMEKRDMRALLFPFVHQIQITARSLGILYGFIRK